MSNTPLIKIQDVAGYPGFKIISVIGELDAGNLDSLVNIVEPFIDQGWVNFLFDLSGLKFIDSSANLHLIRLHMKTRRKNGRIKIFGPHKHIRELFDLMGISKLIPVYDDLKSALKDITIS
jgi:anti-anti-sigma factor